MTQAELAVRSGLGVRTVSNLERGVNTSPYPSTVRVLADALAVPDATRAELVRAARRIELFESGESRPSGGFLGAQPTDPIVARDAELSSIVDALDRLDNPADRTARLVLLAGEPGIGKTRLAQEAMVYSEERGFLVTTGRCYQTQSGTPFAPFFEALATLHAAAPDVVRVASAERWPLLTTLLPDVFPDVDRDAGTSPGGIHRVHRAVAGFAREVAEHRPVAILLDDLHWADGASLELLAYLVRHTPEDRLFLLGTYRDVEVGRGHPLRDLVHGLRREGLVQAVSVGRLDRVGTTRLIAERLGDAPVSDEFGALVHRQTGGNPFFTVELLIALIARGDLSRIDGRWLRRELADLEAPASVSQAIAERVSCLAPETQVVLETVSVLGEAFDLDDLAILDQEDGAVELALEEAVASGLLTSVEGRYAFDHALTQQALYAALSPVRRRRLHRSAAEDLERRAPVVRTRRATDLARHLEAGGLPGRAIPYVLVAGDAAAAMHSPGEAAHHYNHALDLAEGIGDAEAAADALERLGHAEQVTANYESAVNHLVRAADAYRELSDDAARLRVEGMIAHALHRRGDGEMAAARLSGVLTELEGLPTSTREQSGIASLFAGLARVQLGLGRPELALTAAERAGELARSRTSPVGEAEAESLRGLVLLFLDQPDHAVETLERAVDLADRADAVMSHSSALMSLAWANLVQGRPRLGQTFIQRGLELNRQSGDADSEALNLAGLGLNLFYAGEWDEAEEHLLHALELARAGSPTLFSGIPPVYLGVLRQGQGDLVGAEALYADASTAPDLRTFAFHGYLEARRAQMEIQRRDSGSALSRLEPWLGDEAPTRLHDVMLLATAAEACLDLGEVDRGEQLADRALRRAAATKNGLDVVDAQRMKARALLLRGRPESARDRLDDALAQAALAPYPLGEARAHVQVALLCRTDGDHRTELQHLSAAHKILIRLGAALDATAVGQALDHAGVGG